MAANQETPIGDDDLDALMAQLEEETSGLVAAPAAVTAAVVTPAVDPDDLDALAAELGDPIKATSAPTATPQAVQEAKEVVTEVSPALAAKLAALDAAEAAGADDAPFEPEADAGAVKQDDVDAEMAALEAELADAPTASVTKAVEEAAAKVAPETKVVNVREAAEAAKPTTEPEPEPASPNPKPRVPSLEFHIDVEEFRRETRVAETILDDCFMQQAGLVAHYVAQHAHSEAQAARVKLQVEIAEAKLYDQHRKALASGGEKVTEKMVENAVRTDPKYAAIQVRLIEAESIAAINKGLVESLKQRRDMLIQLGADRREDGKGTARILAAQAGDANTAARAMAAAQMGAHRKGE